MTEEGYSAMREERINNRKDSRGEENRNVGDK